MKTIHTDREGAEELARLIDKELSGFGIIEVDFLCSNNDFYSAKVWTGGTEVENWQECEGRRGVESVSMKVTQIDVLEAFVYSKEDETHNIADLVEVELKKVFNLK